jgi:hypothetical protein
MTTKTLAPQAWTLLRTISDLVRVRALAPRQAAVLAIEVAGAAHALENVRVPAATSSLRAFLSTVNTDVIHHRLSVADAKVLRDDAQVILQQVG